MNLPIYVDILSLWVHGVSSTKLTKSAKFRKKLKLMLNFVDMYINVVVNTPIEMFADQDWICENLNK